MRQANYPEDIIGHVEKATNLNAANTIGQRWRSRPLQTNLLVIKKLIRKREGLGILDEDQVEELNGYVKEIEQMIDENPDEPNWWNSEADNNSRRQIKTDLFAILNPEDYGDYENY